MTPTPIPRQRGSASQQVTAFRSDGPAIDYAVRLIYRVCCLAGSASLIDEVRDDDICVAIERRDTAAIFDWLASGTSYWYFHSCRYEKTNITVRVKPNT